MIRTCLLLVAVLAACDRSESPPASPEPSSSPSPSASPSPSPNPSASPSPGPAAPATPSAAAARRALDRYLDASMAMWKEAGAVIEAADDSGRFDHKRMRAALERAHTALGQVDGELATAAADPSFALELCLACIERDWNLNGAIDDGDRQLLQIEYDTRGEELPEGDVRRKPTFRFDVGDLHWARAMIAFQRALLDLVLAYEWDALDLLLVEGDDDRRPPPPTLRIKLADRGRVTRARDLIIAGVDHAERCRQAYLAETDDDREWVPSPRQKSHPVPLPMDAAMYEQWAAILGDVRRLVRGEEAVSASEAGALIDDDLVVATGYVDVGRLLDRPADFVIELGAFDDEKLSPKVALERLLRGFFGAAYVPGKKKSPLTGRLLRMARELEREQDTFERKLRYLLWLN